MDLRDTLLWFLNIPSPVGQEAALADAVQRRLEAIGPTRLRRVGDSVLVTLSTNTGGPKVLLTGHLDVASPAPNASPWLEGNRVIGPGASDVKSGLCLMLDLAESGARPRLDLSLLFTARGTAGYHDHELSDVLTAEPELTQQDLVVVMQPTDNQLKLGSGGTTHATFRFTGQGGHSGMPGAKSAITRALPLLNRLSALAPFEDTVAGLTWYELFNVTRAEAGREGCFIPEQFDINVHHQYGPSCDPHVSQDKLLALAEGSAIVRFEDLAPAAAPVTGNVLVEAWREAGALGVEAQQTGSDVARFAELGVPAVNFGPGAEAQSHRAGEWVDVNALETGRTILRRWLSLISQA